MSNIYIPSNICLHMTHCEIQCACVLLLVSLEQTAGNPRTLYKLIGPFAWSEVTDHEKKDWRIVTDWRGLGRTNNPKQYEILVRRGLPWESQSPELAVLSLCKGLGFHHCCGNARFSTKVYWAKGNQEIYNFCRFSKVISEKKNYQGKSPGWSKMIWFIILPP